MTLKVTKLIFFFSTKFKFKRNEIIKYLIKYFKLSKNINKADITNVEISTFFINPIAFNRWKKDKEKNSTKEIDYKVANANINFLLNLFFKNKQSPNIIIKSNNYKIKDYDVINPLINYKSYINPHDVINKQNKAATDTTDATDKTTKSIGGDAADYTNESYQFPKKTPISVNTFDTLKKKNR